WWTATYAAWPPRGALPLLPECRRPTRRQSHHLPPMRDPFTDLSARWRPTPRRPVRNIRPPLRNIRPPRSLPHVTRRPIQPPRHRLRRNPRRTLSMLPCSTNWRCPWRPIPHRPPNPRPVRSLWMTRWPSYWASFPSIRGRKRGQNPRQKKRPETRPQCHLPTADLPSIVSVNLLAAL